MTAEKANEEISVRRAGDWGEQDRGWLKIFMGLSFGRYQVDGFKDGFGRLKALNRFVMNAGAGSALLDRRETTHLFLVESGCLNFVMEQEVITVNGGEWLWLHAGAAAKFREHNADLESPVVFYEFWLKPHEPKNDFLTLKNERHFDVFQVEYLTRLPGAMTKIAAADSERTWIQLLSGDVHGEDRFAKGDGVALEPLQSLHFQAGEMGAELFVLRMQE